MLYIYCIRSVNGEVKSAVIALFLFFLPLPLPSSDFLVPDYLSHVQEEEEEVLGVQYELEESQHHPVYAGNTSTSTTIPASSSSSVQMAVISQVSSSTQNCESSPGLPGFLSPDSMDPLEARVSFKKHAGGTAALAEETKKDNREGGGSPVLFDQVHHRRPNIQAQELASITIE